jgi:hypothetical protein
VMFSWGVAWSETCMLNVGAWRMLAKCSTRCPPHVLYGLLDSHDIWTHEMWRRAQRHWNYFIRCKALHPDPVTYVGVLNACASAVALEEDEVCS